MAEDDLEFNIQARSSMAPRSGWASATGLPTEIKDLLWAQEQAADLLPYQLPGARTPSLGTVYVRQDVGSGVDDAPGDQPPAPLLDEHGQLIEPPSGPATIRVTVRPPSKPMRAALDADEHLVITGGPGQGKSTLTLRLTAEIVRAWSVPDEDEPPLDEPVVPLRIPARVLAAHLGQSFSQTLASSATAEYGPYLSGPLDSALFARRVAGHRWLLLIDALDEVADSDLRLRIVHTLAAWATKSTYRVLLTTRPAEGGTLAPLQRAGAGRYELLPFDVDALHRFAEHWFEEDIDQARRFLRQVRDARLFELVAVPLLATIAAIVFEKHGERPLPGNQYQLYDSYLTFIQTSRETPEAFERHHTSLVEHLGRTRLRSDIPLVKAVRDWVRCHEDAGSYDDVIAHLTATGPFVPRGNDLTFLHHSFAEHVAATAEARDLPEAFDPDGFADLLHRAKPLEEGRFARQVLLHYTHLHPAEADNVLRWLHNGTGEQHLLAARLLARHMPASAPLVDDFLATVRGWAMTTQFRARLILGQASRATHHHGLRDWLIGLLQDESAPWESRAEAATALAVRLREDRTGEPIRFLRAAVDDLSAPADHRLAAAEALADTGTAEREAAERGLRSVLSDPFATGADCHGAAVVLSAFGGEARDFAVAALERIVSDEDTPINWLVEAATGLAEIDMAFHERCIEVFLGVLRDRVHNTLGRREAAIGLAALGAPQVATEALATLVTDRRLIAGMRGNAAVTLASLGPRQRALAGELLLAQIDAGPEERRQLPAQLSHLCPPEVGAQHLRRVFADSGALWGQVIAAAGALAALGPAFHTEAAAQLQRVLAQVPPMRQDFVGTLRELSALPEPHRGDAITRMRAALVDLRIDPLTRCSTARELIRCAPEYHAEAAEQLMLITRDCDPNVAWAAWTQLDQLGPELRERALKAQLALARADPSSAYQLGGAFASECTADRRTAEEVLTALLGDDRRSLRTRLLAAQGLLSLGGPFHRAAVVGATELIRSGEVLDVAYVARIFELSGRGVRASLAEALHEIIDDELSTPYRSRLAMQALDVLGLPAPLPALRRLVADHSADLDDRAIAAVTLARSDHSRLDEAVELVFRACSDMALESWRELVGDVTALGADVLSRLRELAADRNRQRYESAAAACLLGAEGLPVLRRHVEDGYVDFKSRAHAYRTMVEGADPQALAEAVDVHLAVLHDPEEPMSVRCEAAAALAGLDRSFLPAMGEVLWRFAESGHLVVEERALAADALDRLNAPESQRLATLIAALVRDPHINDDTAARLIRRLPREQRTRAEAVLLADHAVDIADRVPQSDFWDDLPLRAEAEAAIRDILSAPEANAADRRNAAVALSQLCVRVVPEALDLLLAEGTPAARVDAAKHGAWQRVHDDAQAVVDETRSMRERRTAALLLAKISTEPPARDFLLADLDAPWRIRADELGLARAFDDLRVMRDDPCLPAWQRRRAVGWLSDLSLDDRAACGRVLAEIAADPAPPALRWRAADDLADLGPKGRSDALPLLDAIAHNGCLPATARAEAASVICANWPPQRPRMRAVLDRLVEIATPLQRANVLFVIGAWWPLDAVTELRAMAADPTLGPVVRLRAARNAISLWRDERGFCAKVAREVANDQDVPRHVRRRAAAYLAEWSDVCREEARALLVKL
ncbi:NACHT domain-containing protein [Lentzea alba]|uniref:NACHT domain-containing protein n=1 Tax=Lentzea alba TaxID=2714351 RepID=UPI0039BFB8D2